MSNLRDKIKNSDDIKKEIVHIDAWDCDIEVRTMTAKQRANVLNEVMDDNGKMNHNRFHGLMIIYSCYDTETNELIFTENDIDWLLDKSAGPIETLASKITKLSGLSKNAVEEAEKN